MSIPGHHQTRDLTQLNSHGGRFCPFTIEEPTQTALGFLWLAALQLCDHHDDHLYIRQIPCSFFLIWRSEWLWILVVASTQYTTNFAFYPFHSLEVGLQYKMAPQMVSLLVFRKAQPCGCLLIIGHSIDHRGPLCCQILVAAILFEFPPGRKLISHTLIHFLLSTITSFGFILILTLTLILISIIIISYYHFTMRLLRVQGYRWLVF